MRHKKYLPLSGLLLLASCHVPPPPPLSRTGAPLLQSWPAPGPASLQPSAGGRVNGSVANPAVPPLPSASYGAQAPSAANSAPPPEINANGDISFNFADTDIRTITGQILGGILHVNYTIDPSVTGTATLRTVVPLTRAQLIPTLQTLLAQNNATLVQSNGIYRVMPISQANSTPNIASSPDLGGGTVLQLHYTSAQQLASVLQPYVSKGGSIIADPNSNSLLIQGDPATRDALVALAQAFDVDELAGQSYEVFPVADGDAQDFATALKQALVQQTDSKVASNVSVVPLTRISAVLVIARNQSELSDASRVYSVLNQVQRETVRHWHVYYLRNSRANDAAYLLQQAFTPNDVTAQPTPAAKQSATPGQSSNMMGNSIGSAGSSLTGGNSLTGANSLTGSTSPASSTDTSSASSSAPQDSTSSASALLGPLSPTSGGNASTGSGIRIIPDTQNNALLIYATAQEDDQISGMLAKIDIQPLEVRIDATIAEVDLTGALQYGTQYFFKSGDINAVLSNATTAALATNFPGFVLSGNGADAAPLAISALQAVTKVRVLSAPELMVLDGQAASLQVGDLVPYLSQTSQDTVTSNSPVINSINYQQTGIILRVTPHVGSDGLVTMDIDQIVSGVSPTVTTKGLDSPTFTQREITSRIAIQDGQTVGLAGLISDNNSQQNSGLPWIKNIPLLGGVFGTQDNNRTREELLVLITPHVIRTQQQALDLTEDMQQQLPNASMVPNALQSEPFSGSADPDQGVRQKFGGQ